MKLLFRSLPPGLMALIFSFQASANPASLDVDMGAAWNCKIVSGSWREVADSNGWVHGLSIQVVSTSGRVVCPIIAGASERNVSQIGEFSKVWARVRVASGTNYCRLRVRSSTGDNLGMQTLHATNYDTNQSLRFENFPSGSIYTLECTLSQNGILHGYKVNHRRRNR